MTCCVGVLNMREAPGTGLAVVSPLLTCRLRRS